MEIVIEPLPLLICPADGNEAVGSAAALPLHGVTPAELEALLARLPSATSAYVRASGFAGRPHEVVLLPGDTGLAGAVLGLGDATPTPYSFGALPFALPAGTLWKLQADTSMQPDAVLGWCLGAYRYRHYKTPEREPAKLLAPANCTAVLATARAIWRARDLINAPANLLGPAELAEAVLAVGAEYGARCQVIEGAELEQGFPALAAVGQGSPRAPRVVVLEWGPPGAPLVALCGKGVCFDTGGLDLKPSSAMLRMKKDMGGAAVALGVAELLMQAKAPVRLLLLVGAVENSVSGNSFRPMDVLRTRAGLSVEVGNTDAEGRLVLADLMTFAGEHKPAFLLDFATLTGAARVALGPDLPALFCNDNNMAEIILKSGLDVTDPVWRLPLHEDYNYWLNSKTANINTVASKPMAGAIVAALFLKNFLASGISWAHLDLYGWNDTARPGRPEGGEAQAMQATALAIRRMVETSSPALR